MPLDGAGLVVLSHVDYRSGEVADLPAHHGALPRRRGAADLGPLALGRRAAGRARTRRVPSWPWAAPTSTSTPARARRRSCTSPSACRRELRSPIQGWFGQRDQFAMERAYDPEPSIRPLPGRDAADHRAGVGGGGRAHHRRGRDRARSARSRSRRRDLLIALADVVAGGRSASALGSPRDAERRGSHVALRHPQAWQITRALVEVANVVPDFRGPDAVRLGHRAALHALRRHLGRDGPAAPARRGR